MAIRSTWKGYLKVSLVSVPLKAYTASSSSSRPISLNQLHETCKSRIQYRKVCPVHGEVPSDEIVSGYEYSKGHYVVIESEEIDKLRTESDRSITVDAFVGAATVDPIYHSGQTYYLVPDGPIGQKPYALIQQSIADEGLNGVGRVVISNKERLVLLRPIEKLIAMTVLQYQAQVKQPSGFEDELVEMKASAQELKLTKTLLEGLTREDLDIGEYTDAWVERMTELVEAKVQGKEIVSPPAPEEPEIINLMDALKQSVNQLKGPRGGEKKKPGRKMAPSARSRAARKSPGKRRKSS